ncbi:hypothetical protein EYF80_041193 [Liparis tanakae]|uniref:Uncharacterized protein n=1 Tax=Liparis tanakae TaxID=230148 RepID=A0A4Z2G4W2_9TELE|nr:hypothetical protein EYF80_041193 [Liparis tanakae]
MSSISARSPRFSTSSSTMRRLSRLASSSTSFRWTLISASRVWGESATWWGVGVHCLPKEQTHKASDQPLNTVEWSVFKEPDASLRRVGVGPTLAKPTPDGPCSCGLGRL